MRGPSLVAASLALGLLATPGIFSQDASRSNGTAPAQPAAAQTSTANSAEALYQQLSTVGLDRSRVFKIRDASLDRAACHITLDDGTIAFTQDVAGHVTGAFFEGDGEVLLAPPDQVERGSMALFTGAAILEENFVTAYFRFNDDTFKDLQPFLRPADDSQEFVSQWDETARNLAEPDALRLLLSFSRYLPSLGQTPSPPPAALPRNTDRLLHARMRGRKLGPFDVYFDGDAPEQIRAGQMRTVEGTTYYDEWTSFAPSEAGAHSADIGDVVTGQGRSKEVAVSTYKIRAAVTPPSELDAEAWLQMQVREDSPRAVLFELSRFLRIKQVDADGVPVEFIHNQALEGTQLARRGNDLVAVVFPQPLHSGQKITLHFVYGGEVLSEAGKGLLYVGARGTWYPNRGLEISNFDLEFHYPTAWTLVATGKRVEVSAPGATGGNGEMESRTGSSGEQVNRWVSERPIPLAGFNLGKYSRAAAQAGDIQVETYATSGVERTFPQGTAESGSRDPGFPSVSHPRLRVLDVPPPPFPSPARNAQVVAQLSAHAIEFFASHFGPYPYSSLAVTQMPGNISQGWPSLVFLSSFSFLTSEEKARLRMSPVERTLSSSVIAHETAHQWWGDLVTSNSYRDQWLVEALANYSALMLLESEDPSQFHAVLEKYRDDLLTENKNGLPLAEAGPVTLGTRLTCSHFPAGYETISYGRGTWLFHMLRNMMRTNARKSAAHPLEGSDARAPDELFFRALRTLRERYQGRSVTTREMLQVFEEELPPSLWYEGRKSLEWFYQGWVNGTTLPRLELHDVKYNDKPVSTVIGGTIVQNDAPKDLVTCVPVYAVLGGRTTFLGMVFADGPETGFHLSAPAGTRKIVLDPYHTLLTRLR